MGKLSVTVGGGGGGGRKKGIGGILGLKGAPLLLGGLNSSNPVKSNQTVQVRGRGSGGGGSSTAIPSRATRLCKCVRQGTVYLVRDLFEDLGE